MFFWGHCVCGVLDKGEDELPGNKISVGKMWMFPTEESRDIRGKSEGQALGTTVCQQGTLESRLILMFFFSPGKELLGILKTTELLFYILGITFPLVKSSPSLKSQTPSYIQTVWPGNRDTGVSSKGIRGRHHTLPCAGWPGSPWPWGEQQLSAQLEPQRAVDGCFQQQTQDTALPLPKIYTATFLKGLHRPGMHILSMDS